MLLDDLKRFHELDPSRLITQLDALPDNVEAGWKRGQSLLLPKAFARAERIVIVGMGPSALAGDLLAALVADSCNIPVIVLRGYDLPAFVDGQSTLVIGITHTGCSEETLSAIDLAAARGGQLLVITANTELQQQSELRGRLPGPDQ